ncbi:MAG TPA: rod shape-determining protein RodA [Chitinophagaceae bacterium]|nr:rod shape-determining protein RodA [Chitinophagaceae bacterium]MCC6633964.1 rod shape-determining protein RodA [Chitinophagaceae bacterium]HMZ45377.1 rod shape-determining protein RodA [Chitinophagaceae bacterium]HNF30236.1 rod shape-determining protein RodA [Chitinophagaceae bacterium]HNL82776.1 rod shape-determining protein RodA [Chitinophagaceae bacterium]
MSIQHNSMRVSQKTDTLIIWLYAILVTIGICCIFMVEYKPGMNVMQNILGGTTNFSKQTLFAGVCVIVATFIMLSDSKLFTAFANLFYAFGIVLMLATFVLGKNINGSKSWIPLGGGFNLQPAELCKIFVSLALAKYLSRQETDFSKLKSQIIGAAIAMVPAILSIAQQETGLALVYSAFFIVMYREGLPSTILITGISVIILVVATLLLEPNTLAIILTLIAAIIIFILRRQIKRQKNILTIIVTLWLVCVSIQRFAVPYFFDNVLKCYQSTRVYSMVGKDYDCTKNKHASNNTSKAVRKPDDYNVRQSKIAIGSGGVIGKGYLKGTQTRGKYVPEQSTDFIFTSIGEAFGFVGSFIFLLLYLLLLLRIIRLAERQRSTFSRVYAYSVVSILFFHITVNICMTIGLFPIIGIPLPLISYGGSSLLTFTILIFIMLRLDADRQMVLR